MEKGGSIGSEARRKQAGERRVEGGAEKVTENCRYVSGKVVENPLNRAAWQ